MGPIEVTFRFPAYPPCAGLGPRDLKSGTREAGRASATGMRERACRQGRIRVVWGTNRAHPRVPVRSPTLHASTPRRSNGEQPGPPDPPPHRRSQPPRTQKAPHARGLKPSGRYWARTSDLRLVEAALSQLS